MRKVLIVFGTRPEAIKLAPVILKLKASDSAFVTKVCVTAQHREMLDQVLKIFDIKPDYDLDIMQDDQDLFDITANSLMGLRKVLERERPDLVLVQGDTTTAFVAGLTAYYFKTPLGHIEAGLRTYNKYNPFPEEKNRQLLSVLTDYHFAPTEWAKANLVKEGVPDEKIWVTGNTVIDSLLLINNKQKTSNNKEHWVAFFKHNYNLSLDNNARKTILVTGHRRENFGKGFENICFALKEIAERRKDVDIVYPVHLNPNVQRPVNNILNGKSNIHLIGPLEYGPFVFLMSKSAFVLTDSGGIQEEAPSLGKPVLVMRNTTERPEGIKAGTAKLVDTDKEKIVHNTIELLDNKLLYEKMSKANNPYGDGRAAERITEALCKL